MSKLSPDRKYRGRDSHEELSCEAEKFNHCALDRGAISLEVPPSLMEKSHESKYLRF